MTSSGLVFYHGTDARIARLSKEEREAIKTGCVRFLDDIYQIFKPYMSPESFQEFEGRRLENPNEIDPRIPTETDPLFFFQL